MLSGNIALGARSLWPGRGASTARGAPVVVAPPARARRCARGARQGGTRQRGAGASCLDRVPASRGSFAALRCTGSPPAPLPGIRRPRLAPPSVARGTAARGVQRGSAGMPSARNLALPRASGAAAAARRGPGCGSGRLGLVAGGARHRQTGARGRGLGASEVDRGRGREPGGQAALVPLLAQLHAGELQALRADPPPHRDHTRALALRRRRLR
mmetsp:Transcript_148931/g.478529  ORF Transcript_148931/g.478529 Transcript_148931/m.478529 type:complete len:214 (-) Transcript_148931:926-1567(-)